uniref:sn-1-specific diacylglycerol lipase n=1 Tax=Strigamia maritima TaxID=126957 RepID=T1JG97_STRMM
MIAIIIVYELHHGFLSTCQKGRELNIYLIGVIVVLLLVILLNFIIFLISMKGTIMNTEPRRHMSKALTFRSLIICPEISWNLYGTYLAFAAQSNCPTDVLVTIKVTVICGWILFWGLLFATAIIFDPLGNEMYNKRNYDAVSQNAADERRVFEAQGGWAHKVWERRLQTCFCCCIGDEESQEVYSILARQLSSFFQDVDLVPSDIAAGLVLLHQQEKNSLAHQNFAVVSQQPNKYGNAQFTAEEKPLSWQPWMTPELTAHYMKFAAASYGWPAHIYSNCSSGLCQLYKNITCCASFRRPTNYITDDNCCRCHIAALTQMTGLTEDDLTYVSFQNRIYQVPFFVAIDHQTCAVVIAIRGTMSARDALTDLTIDCEPLNIPDLPITLGAHKGMLCAARYVEKRLRESNALNDALSLYPSFNVVVTGHSLGAGTAAVLALLLRPMYPGLRCFTFSPPGALLNRETAQFSEEFILSVVVGYDLVPRLSYATMDELKRRLMRALYACHSPKFRILINECFDCCFGFGAQYEWSTASTPGQSNPLLTETSGGHQNTTYESLSEIVHTSPLTRVPYMYLPGLIMHFEVEDTEDKQDPIYKVSWADPEHFNRIIVMPNMVFDHDPFIVLHALQTFVAQTENQFDTTNRTV